MKAEVTFYLDEESGLDLIKSALQTAEEGSGEYSVVGKFMGVPIKGSLYGLFMVDSSGRLDRLPSFVSRLPVREVMIEVTGTGAQDELHGGSKRLGGIWISVRKWRDVSGVLQWRLQIIGPSYEQVITRYEEFFPTENSLNKEVWGMDRVAEEPNHRDG